ncbi:MAG TPA: biotin/lipoate A/B protein ligase family protein [Smithella sp.]|jgi:lipoate-protein ligase A|nr:biotin/lipoate A/B protein ligase family protein [Smithella sp.]HOG10451.1 biotin/lipoate A/B protein ligase family protein [Smithella sp.]HOX98278.1 biotin/lipoate A/B protein ligase family protein [Smithella sp.]HPC07575.1 biotin/lipoate A/B protein ligase family protein [Smithella sp.]HPK21162.1 biotin/lipoate A/B protein ligase family protein [Smithella sp.]
MGWRFLNYQTNNIFENMAIDEAIFRGVITSKTESTIRFYGSEPEAVSIGYFQDAKKDLNLGQCRHDGIDVVRRITGGRAVFHCNEITYSVTAGSGERIFPDNISGTYRVISKCLVRGLGNLGIDARLAETGDERNQGEKVACCFSTSAENEILVNGRKICGSAQVRRRGGFLQHGLLFYRFDPEGTANLLLSSRSPEQIEKLKQSVTSINEYLCQPLTAEEICETLKKSFCDELGIHLGKGSLTPAEEKLKNELMKKYTDGLWNIEREKYFKAV